MSALPQPSPSLYPAGILIAPRGAMAATTSVLALGPDQASPLRVPIAEVAGEIAWYTNLSPAALRDPLWRFLRRRAPLRDAPWTPLSFSALQADLGLGDATPEEAIGPLRDTLARLDALVLAQHGFGAQSAASLAHRLAQCLPAPPLAPLGLREAFAQAQSGNAFFQMAAAARSDTAVEGELAVALPPLAAAHWMNAAPLPHADTRWSHVPAQPAATLAATTVPYLALVPGDHGPTWLTDIEWRLLARLRAPPPVASLILADRDYARAAAAAEPQAGFEALSTTRSLLALAHSQAVSARSLATVAGVWRDAYARAVLADRLARLTARLGRPATAWSVAGRVGRIAGAAMTPAAESTCLALGLQPLSRQVAGKGTGARRLPEPDAPPHPAHVPAPPAQPDNALAIANAIRRRPDGAATLIALDAVIGRADFNENDEAALEAIHRLVGRALSPLDSQET